jgi:hypothetical protein
MALTEWLQSQTYGHRQPVPEWSGGKMERRICSHNTCPPIWGSTGTEILVRGTPTCSISLQPPCTLPYRCHSF